MEVELEVKADALDGAFDAVLAAEAVDELKASVAALKAQVERQALAAARLPLCPRRSGTGSCGWRSIFTRRAMPRTRRRRPRRLRRCGSRGGR